jgi:polysaccharide biosynthesis/export protein
MRLPHVTLALALAASVSACASYRPPPPAFHKALNEPYRLDSGDKVRVTVFEQEGLTNSYAVDKSGYVSIPLVGALPARGQTTEDLEAAVAAKLRDGFLRDPDVSVEIETYRPFFIMGEVTQGGQYSYVPGMTVQNAIAAAGGFTARAEQKTVDLTRQVNGKVASGRVLTSDPIQPGDNVFVRERWF